MGPRRLVGIWLDVRTHVLWVFKNEPYSDHIAHWQNIPYWPDSEIYPTARSFSSSSFLNAQCSSHSYSPWSIVSYPMATLAKGVLNNIYSLQMGSSASMVGRQTRHRHLRSPFRLPWKPSMPRSKPSVLSNSNNGSSRCHSIFTVTLSAV
jgi:hypothetical protein